MLRKSEFGGFMRFSAITWTAAVGLCSSWGISFAQTIPSPEIDSPERLSILQQARPDYDALGLRVGSFIVNPNVELDGTYNSNVYGTTKDVKGDLFFTESPAVSVRSNWNNNSLNFDASGAFHQYVQLTTEDTNDASTDINGRYDISTGVYLYGLAGYQLLHEDRTSPNAVFGKNPTQYQVGTGDFGYVHEIGRLGFRTDFKVQSYAYYNSTSSSGLTLDQTYRDYTGYKVTPKLTYEIVPGYHAFVQASGNYRYYNSLDPSGIDRTSYGWEVDAGTAISLGRVINGDVFVGYISQEYKDHVLVPVHGPGFGGDLLWNVTQQTSVHLLVARTVEESTVVGSSGILQTIANLSLEHEFLRNVLGSANVGYTMQDFEGLGRTDDYLSGGISGKYLLNRNWSVGLDASYTQRTSNANNSSNQLNYTGELIALKLRYKL